MINLLKENNSEKYTNGITLIALVVTIIILLILAGVSIAMLTGDNGILKQASDAKIMTNLSKVDEAIKLYKSNLKINKIIDEESSEEITNDDLIEDGILKEYIIEETSKPIAIIEDYTKLNIKDKFGEGYKNIKPYKITGENTPYIGTLEELNNVCAIDLTDGTLYYIENRKVCSIDGETYIANHYERVNADTEEWNFDETTRTLIEYKGNLATKRGEQEVGEVIIPNYYNGIRVSIIGSNIFKNNTNLTKLTISDGIQEIGDYAFNECQNLKGDLIIPNSVILVGERAFWNCNKMNGKLKLSNNLVTIGKYAFAYCSNLTGNIVIAKSVTTFAGGCFYNDAKLESLTIEEGCTASLNPVMMGTVAYGAFTGCKGLTGTIVIPESFGDLGNGCFDGCTGIEEIEIKSKNIVTIGHYAFRECTNLKGNLIIPDTVTTIGLSAFYNCANLTGELKLSKNIKYIFSSAFYNCSGLDRLVIEDGCKANNAKDISVFKSIFENCTGLKGGIVIPSTYGNMGDNTFSGCTGVEKITIKNKACTIYDGEGTFDPGIDLSGYENSTAQAYATKYNRTFEIIQ